MTGPCACIAERQEAISGGQHLLKCGDAHTCQAEGLRRTFFALIAEAENGLLQWAGGSTAQLWPVIAAAAASQHACVHVFMQPSLALRPTGPSSPKVSWAC